MDVLVKSVAIPAFMIRVVAVFWWLVPKIENRFIFRPDRRTFRTPLPIEGYPSNASFSMLLT